MIIRRGIVDQIDRVYVTVTVYTCKTSTPSRPNQWKSVPIRPQENFLIRRIELDMIKSLLSHS